MMFEIKNTAFLISFILIFTVVCYGCSNSSILSEQTPSDSSVNSREEKLTEENDEHVEYENLEELEEYTEPENTLTDSEKLINGLMSNLLSEHNPHIEKFIQSDKLKEHTVRYAIEDVHINLPTSFEFNLKLVNKNGSVDIPSKGEMFYFTPSVISFFQANWGGVSVVGDMIAVCDLKNFTFYDLSTLDKIDFQLDGLDTLLGTDAVNGISFSEEYGYLVPVMNGNNPRMIYFDADGNYVKSVDIDPFCFERLSTNFSDAPFVGEENIQFFQDLNFIPDLSQSEESESWLCLAEDIYIGNFFGTIVYSLIDEKIYLISRKIRLDITDENYLELMEYNSEKTEHFGKYIAVRKNASDEVADHFTFDALVLSNDIYWGYYDNSFECEIISPNRYMFTNPYSGDIFVDFENKIGDIDYKLSNEDIVEENLLAQSQNGTYSAYRIRNNGMGDGFWYDIAIKNNRDGSINWLGRRGDFMDNEVQFVDDDTIFFKNDNTFYQADTLTPTETVEFENKNRVNANILFDPVSQKFVALSAYYRFSDAFETWYGFYDTTLYIDIYARDGTLEESIDTGTIVNYEGLYVTYAPEFTIENGVFQYEDYIIDLK